MPKIITCLLFAAFLAGEVITVIASNSHLYTAVHIGIVCLSFIILMYAVNNSKKGYPAEFFGATVSLLYAWDMKNLSRTFAYQGLDYLIWMLGVLALVYLLCAACSLIKDGNWVFID